MIVLMRCKSTKKYYKPSKNMKNIILIINKDKIIGTVRLLEVESLSKHLKNLNSCTKDLLTKI